MSMTKAFAMAVVAGLSMTSAASAITITSIDGLWQNANAGVSGEGSNQIRWGVGYDGGPQSGYDFTATASEVTATPGSSFVIGTFDHINLPLIRSTFLEAVDLAVSFNIAGVAKPISTVFSFTHDETNNRKTCNNGYANGHGVNINGCADNVTATRNEAHTEHFEMAGVSYVLEILGFQVAGNLFENFLTSEDAINRAELVGALVQVDPEDGGSEGEVPPTLVDGPIDPPSEVPLPASGLLLLGGLAGLYAKKKRAAT